MAKILFCHIPRNGGTFISRNIANSVGFERTFSVDRTNITLEHFLQFKQSIIETYDFITGHIPFQFVTDVADQFDLILVNVRSPLQRVISSFYFEDQKSTECSGSALFYYFKTYLERRFTGDIATRNEQCGYIGLYNRFESAFDVINSRSCLRIVRTERLIEDLRIIFEEFGLKLLLNEGRNESHASKDTILRNLDPETYLSIFQWFDDDYLLYEYCAATGPR